MGILPSDYWGKAIWRPAREENTYCHCFFFAVLVVVVVFFWVGWFVLISLAVQILIKCVIIIYAGNAMVLKPATNEGLARGIVFFPLRPRFDIHIITAQPPS